MEKAVAWGSEGLTSRLTKPTPRDCARESYPCVDTPLEGIPIILESERVPRVWGCPRHQISGAGVASCPHGRWELNSGSLDAVCALNCSAIFPAPLLIWGYFSVSRLEFIQTEIRK